MASYIDNNINNTDAFNIEIPSGNLKTNEVSKIKILENILIMYGMEKFLENTLEEHIIVTVVVVAMIGSKNAKKQILLENGN